MVTSGGEVSCVTCLAYVRRKSTLQTAMQVNHFSCRGITGNRVLDSCSMKMVYIDSQQKVISSHDRSGKACTLIRRARLTSDESEVDNYAITELIQGQSRRWAIA